MIKSRKAVGWTLVNLSEVSGVPVYKIQQAVEPGGCGEVCGEGGKVERD